MTSTTHIDAGGPPPPSSEADTGSDEQQRRKDEHAHGHARAERQRPQALEPNRSPLDGLRVGIGVGAKESDGIDLGIRVALSVGRRLRPVDRGAGVGGHSRSFDR